MFERVIDRLDILMKIQACQLLNLSSPDATLMFKKTKIAEKANLLEP